MMLQGVFDNAYEERAKRIKGACPESLDHRIYTALPHVLTS